MQSSTFHSFARRCWLLVVTALALMLVACSSTKPKPVPEADILPTPEGVRYEMRYFNANDGVRLFRQAWIPEGKTKGVLIVVHGLKDHGGRYEAVGQHLAQQGFAVFAADLRGHGRSGGPRQMVDNFDDYLFDLSLMIRQVQAQHPDTPIFLLGHSMGGTIATRYAELRPRNVKGLALSAAALEVRESKYKLWGLKALAAIAPSAPALSLDLKSFSRDPAVVEASLSDPLVTQSGVPARTALELVEEIKTLQDEESRLTMPMLIMHGTSDTITPLSGSIALYDSVPSTKKVLKQYPGLAHDLLHEPEKDTVLADLTEWLNSLVAK